jgi:hypothetical protein
MHFYGSILVKGKRYWGLEFLHGVGACHLGRGNGRASRARTRMARRYHTRQNRRILVDCGLDADLLMCWTNETATCGFWVGYPWGNLTRNTGPSACTLEVQYHEDYA